MPVERDARQERQEAEYDFPYHYIPLARSGSCSQTLHWPWGMRYLAGLELVFSVLSRMEFSSVLDVGCGDGRFLRELRGRWPGVKSLGVDYSEKAIALARALNPSMDFECLDINHYCFNEQYEVITLIEVLEHIPIGDVSRFLESLVSALVKGGSLVLTVPHVNRKLQLKHFQHFSSSHLRDVLSQYFQVIEIVPFDRRTKATSMLSRLLGGTGSHFVITNKRINRLLFDLILRECLSMQPEEHCGRLLAVARCPL